MNKFFFSKLAFNNIIKNRKTYFPYIVTCIGTIMMYYMISFMGTNDGLKTMAYGDVAVMFMDIGMKVVAIFAAIFLCYTNSFLIKRRKKEFGLYNILGMEKKHITRIIFLEVIYVAVGSLLIGIGLGILLSKAMLMLLLKVANLSNVSFAFQISEKSLLYTLVLFGLIFLVTFLMDMRQIHLSNPVELLKGGSVGEKEPKVKWIIALLGIVTLGVGYGICIKVENPMDAVGVFFLAVILVVIGTYCLFTAISIAILKLLKKNKKFYYKTNHFIAVSGMMYRMKQNAVGLANICILGTGVLILISSTASLYNGLTDVCKKQIPYGVTVEVTDAEYEDQEKLAGEIRKVIADQKAEQKNELYYNSTILYTSINGGKIEADPNAYKEVIFVTKEDYNRIEGENISLKENEVLVYGEKLPDQIEIGKEKFHVVKQLEEYKGAKTIYNTVVKENFIIVDKEETIAKIIDGMDSLADEAAREKQVQRQFFYGTDITDEDKQMKVAKAVEKYLTDKIVKEQTERAKDNSNGSAEKSADDSVDDSAQNISSSMAIAESQKDHMNGYMAIFGSMLFLGVFLAVLFLMAVVLIMYYKQMSEGYEDKERFAIMKKVGMSHREIKSTIQSQVLIVFFLPLVVSCVHIRVAYVIIKKMLFLLGLTNSTIFLVSTFASVAAFALVYGIIYAVTARAYYKIVE